MKKLCSVFLMLLASVWMVVSAQNTITVHQKDGQKVSFGFGEKPVITYTDNSLVLTTSNSQVECALSNVEKITFLDSDATINAVVDISKAPALSLDNYVVSIEGAKSDATVMVVGSDGKTLINTKTDSDGSVTFSIAELPDGVYVIKSENLTYKILKK